MSEISKENIYFVNAHPDDINAGLGLALILTEIDHYRIHLVDFTRGERGLIEQGVSEAECAAIRTKEEEAVCRELGITSVFLHETDGNAYACRETCMELAEYFKVSPPRAIITHWPLDIHQDHVMCAAAVMKAVKLAQTAPELYFYRQSHQTLNMPDDYYIPFDEKIMLRKCELLKLYKCQQGDQIAMRQQRDNATYGCRNRVPYAECFASCQRRLPGQSGFFEELALYTPERSGSMTSVWKKSGMRSNKRRKIAGVCGPEKQSANSGVLCKQRVCSLAGDQIAVITGKPIKNKE